MININVNMIKSKLYPSFADTKWLIPKYIICNNYQSQNSYFCFFKYFIIWEGDGESRSRGTQQEEG